jgi:hypothetical protein
LTVICHLYLSELHFSRNSRISWYFAAHNNFRHRFKAVSYRAFNFVSNVRLNLMGADLSTFAIHPRLHHTPLEVEAAIASGRSVKSMKPLNDRRSTPRRKQLKAGMIAFHGRHSTLTCRVRDISETGVRLEVENAQVPDTFELLVELDGLEAHCAVVWRRGSVVGAMFTSPPKIRAPKRVQIVTPTGSGERPSLRRKQVK